MRDKGFNIYMLCLMEFLFFGYVADGFASGSNILNIIRQFSVLGIMVTGQCVVMISGCVDFSVGEQIAMDGMFLAMLLVHVKLPVWIAVSVTLAAGILFGVLNGIICSYLKIEPSLGTFGSMIFLNGLVYVIFKGHSILGLSGDLQVVRDFSLLNMPIAFWILVIIGGIGSFILNDTYWGRFLYATGENPEAAGYVGIDSRRIKMQAYIFCGVLTGIAAVITVSYNNAALPYVGNDYMSDCIVACSLGKISLTGGKGRLSEALTSALFVVMLTNGLRIMNMNNNLIGCIKGIILLLTLINYFRISEEIIVD